MFTASVPVLHAEQEPEVAPDWNRGGRDSSEIKKKKEKILHLILPEK